MQSAITIESLLEAANSSSETDTSINLARRVFLDQSACDAFFAATCVRLLDIGKWSQLSSATEYALFDRDGVEITGKPAAVGGFIRIALYGTGKYDWVTIISISEEPDEMILTVKPAHDPTEKPPKPEEISHFFGPEATNNFCVQRTDKTVVFYVIGLNEHQNSRFTDSLIESARNLAVANVGYYSGLQKTVWKEFCLNFLKTDEELRS